MLLDVGRLRQYAAEGLTRIAIAEKMGMSYSRTTTALRENGISVKRKKHDVPKRGPKEQTKKILELRRQGLTHKQIADALGCCEDTAKVACVKYGMKTQGPPLTEEQAAEVISQAGYDYMSGFVNSHSTVSVRCRKCGGIFERTYKNMREEAAGAYKYKAQCPYCWKKEVEAYRKEKRAPKEHEAHERAQRKAERDSRKTSDDLARRLATRVCKNCGKEYCIACSGYNSEQYCSEKCQKRYVNREKNDKRKDKLKSRKHDTDITLEKLFKRDGGVCYICGCACDWSDITEGEGTMIAGNMYPSIDHVKPVAKGGTHTWDNIRLACRACNIKKRDGTRPLVKKI